MSCVSIVQDTEVSDGVGSGFLLLTCHNKLVWMWIAVSGCRLSLNLRQQRRRRPRHHHVVRSSSWYPLLVQLIVRKSACGDSYCVVQVCIHMKISEKKRGFPLNHTAVRSTLVLWRGMQGVWYYQYQMVFGEYGWLLLFVRVYFVLCWLIHQHLRPCKVSDSFCMVLIF